MGQKNPVTSSLLSVHSTKILASVLFVFFRLVFMITFPIFNDEALTIRYGKISVETPMHFYTLAVGGKQPLLYWIDGIMTHIIPDPLLAGRIVSLLFGILTFFGLYRLAVLIASPWVASIALLAYAVSPVNIMFDSLAIHDTAIAAIYCWIILHITVLTKHFSWYRIICIGMLIGFGLWIKTTALLFYGITMICFVILWKKQLLSNKYAIFSWISVTVIVLLMTIPMIARPEFAGVIRMQPQYAMTIADILKFPYTLWLSNLRDILLVYAGYVSPVMLIAAVLMFITKKKSVSVLMVFVCFIVAFVLLIVTGKSLHSRYVLFSTIPLFPLFALFQVRFPRLFTMGLATMVVFATTLSLKPDAFFHIFPNRWVYSFESFQYIDGWPSGFGVKEAIAFADTHRSGKPAFFGVRWDAGNPEDTVLLYAPKLQGVVSSFFDPKLSEFADIVRQMRSRPMYLITRDNQRGGLDGQVELLARFPKPRGTESVEVYAFDPEKYDLLYRNSSL